MIITLLTDFGTSDWFVGAMKGVIAQRSGATITDITHSVPPGDVFAGAYLLRQCYRYFPAGTVHLAVVDPGVGGPRHAIAVETARYHFVGPDNGLLSFALQEEKPRTIRRLENEALFLKPVSQTFHGRDIFAPVAAYLSEGGSFERLGPAARSFCRLRWPKPQRRKGRWRGQIVYIDRFGNALTNLPWACLPDLRRSAVRLADGQYVRFGSSYDQVRPGEAVALKNSTDSLEIAVRDGNAREQLSLRVGDQVSIIDILPPVH